LNDRAEAEEALQEVFVKIWTKADRFAVSELSPISWLVAIARNHSIDRIRSRRQPSVDVDAALDIADPTPGPEAMAVAVAKANVFIRTVRPLCGAPICPGKAMPNWRSAIACRSTRCEHGCAAAS
jgi:RNA polymerase sigma-70 factor, ECF subfamily